MADRLLFPPTTFADIASAAGTRRILSMSAATRMWITRPSARPSSSARWKPRVPCRGARPANWKTPTILNALAARIYGFLVSSGVIDSMVNHYTAAKRRRSSDVYTPGGRAARRPDRAVNVYCRLIREAYGDIPIAHWRCRSLSRRFAHYDYWDDAVRPSILVDSGADLLMFGMGERTILVTADWMSRGAPHGNAPRCAAYAFSPRRPCAAAGKFPLMKTASRAKRNTEKRFSISITSRTRSAAMPSANVTATAMSCKPCRICRFPAKSWIIRIPCRISGHGILITTR